MKTILLALVALFVAACQTTGQPVQLTNKTPAQIAADVCPPIQAVLTVLTVPGAVDPAIAVDIVAASQVIGLACSAGDATGVPDLRSLADNAIPLLIKNAALLPIDPDQKQSVILALAVAKAAIGSVAK